MQIRSSLSLTQAHFRLRRQQLKGVTKVSAYSGFFFFFFFSSSVLVFHRLVWHAGSPEFEREREAM